MSSDDPVVKEVPGKPLGSVGGGLAATEKLVATGDPDYDAKMQELWGGPPPRFWDAAMDSWPTEHVPGAGKRALITGSSGGIGLSAPSPLCCQVLFSPALLRALCHCAAHPPRPCVHSYVARLLARCGYTVIIPARPNFEEDAEGAATAIARETPGADVVIPATKLDLTSLASCREVRRLPPPLDQHTPRLFVCCKERSDAQCYGAAVRRGDGGGGRRA